MSNGDLTSNMELEFPLKHPNEDEDECKSVEALITGVERLGRNSTDENYIPVDPRSMNDHSSNVNSATVSSADSRDWHRRRVVAYYQQCRKNKTMPYRKLTVDERRNSSRASYINNPKPDKIVQKLMYFQNLLDETFRQFSKDLRNRIPSVDKASGIDRLESRISLVAEEAKINSEKLIHVNERIRLIDEQAIRDLRNRIPSVDKATGIDRFGSRIRLLTEEAKINSEKLIHVNERIRQGDEQAIKDLRNQFWNPIPSVDKATGIDQYGNRFRLPAEKFRIDSEKLPIENREVVIDNFEQRSQNCVFRSTIWNDCLEYIKQSTEMVKNSTECLKALQNKRN